MLPAAETRRRRGCDQSSPAGQSQLLDITKAAFTAVLWNDPNLSRGTDGLQTRRWREPDSNHRFRVARGASRRVTGTVTGRQEVISNGASFTRDRGFES